MGDARDVDGANAPGPWRLGALGALLLRLVDSGIPAEMRSGDPDPLRRARIILSFTLVLIVLGVETLVFFTWALPREASLPIGIALLAALGSTLAIPWTLRRLGSLELAANLVIGASYLVICTIFTVIGGIQAPLLHWCGLLPMLAVLMGARRSAWAWVGVGFGTLAFFAGAEASGWHFSDQLGLAQLEGSKVWIQRSVDVGSWLVILMAVAVLYEAHREQQTRQLAEQNVALASEIEQRSKAEQRTHYLAYYDELTTLPNRRLFQQQLETSMAQAERLERAVAVLFLDLDGFKEVNDSHGHTFGDRLLQQVAQRLRGCIRLSDSAARITDADPGVVSRLGGDEFTVLLTGIRSHREAAIVAQRIVRSFEGPFALDDDLEVFITASIGIALYPGGAESLDDLLRNADLAMYHAKERGKNNFQFFEEPMNTDVVRHTALANELRRALDHRDLELHYQPIVDTSSLESVGVEALVRWNHAELGMVPAGEFIGVAEESGLIARLGDWVVRQACRDIDKWRGAGFAPDRVAINVSGAQFRHGRILGTVVDAIREFDIEPSRLEIEVTEGAMMVDENEAERCLAALKGLGLSVALDDFGTGYSSLSYVKRFPVDALKIDRSFVCEIESDPDARAIVTAIIAMGHQLGLKVVGEGVETEDQERLLREHGCDELQGYRFGRPAPSDELLRRWSANL